MLSTDILKIKFGKKCSMSEGVAKRYLWDCGFSMQPPNIYSKTIKVILGIVRNCRIDIM